ncbi:haloalkane dehalogenase [Streptomyces sp. A3M-1-3]|uniref:haloalkane dehalogenase n=1 Tax=Streptomyces sp. A3M-1-3 TaxID=2962044 RepID=UPI0020B7689C|nr:haloalkane dehalogenase [Streptomyces sp. A3M-1-3]MCP3821352.1 haloalkane dehalogenase [Streptomyces sp. A3M-1-3]
MPTIDVLDSTMYYEDSGSGTPFVFLHGNPASSYLWRHVLPRIGDPGRCLAPDLIGMGRSGKPDVPYRFADHARYLDAWIDRLGLDGVVLVGIDWGGALAFDWAARHPGRTRGMAFMETIVRPMTWDEFPAAARSRFEAFRTPGTGEALVLDQNVFIEEALSKTVLGGLSDEDLAAYRRPYPTRDSRRPLLEWPRAMPLDGEPADVVGRITAYDAWLASSADVPKLLLTFDSSPTLMVGEEMAAWCAAHIAGLETEHCGPAAHLAPEDRPEAIAAAITTWADRHRLRSAWIQDVVR